MNTHPALQAVSGPTAPIVMCELGERVLAKGERVQAKGDAADRVELSVREREILIAWLRTDSKDAVARAFYLTPSTVRTYLQRIRAKYARAGRPARTKAALAARAIQDGYIGLNDL